jgi:hypothetical protein
MAKVWTLNVNNCQPSVNVFPTTNNKHNLGFDLGHSRFGRRERGRERERERERGELKKWIIREVFLTLLS